MFCVRFPSVSQPPVFLEAQVTSLLEEGQDQDLRLWVAWFGGSGGGGDDGGGGGGGDMDGLLWLLFSAVTGRIMMRRWRVKSMSSSFDGCMSHVRSSVSCSPFLHEVYSTLQRHKE